MILNGFFTSIIIYILISINKPIYSQSLKTFSLPEPVKIELKRLDETYKILDQYSNEVWHGWNDYLSYPILMNFQNGLRVLIGHPVPPIEFVPYPTIKVHGLTLCIDTSKLTNYILIQPLQSGGGVQTLGTFNRKPVTIVDLRFTAPVNKQMKNSEYKTGEEQILLFIHELMHCYQGKILKKRYGNLRIDSDLKYALYSDIEGQALSKAYEQDSLEKSLPYLKDFCVARRMKMKGLNTLEKNQYSSDEFNEGEAVFAEFKILQCIKKGFKSSFPSNYDPDYKRFENADIYLNKYLIRLNKTTSETLNILGKFYLYGCFQAILLDRYFPDWKKDVEGGLWLDQILEKGLTITSNDSLTILQRFQNIYHFNELKSKHDITISARDETYKMFKARKGREYIINTSIIGQFLPQHIDTSAKSYNLGRTYMYPDGIGDIIFDGISISVTKIPTEIYNSYNLRVIDTNLNREDKAYSITYKSKDADGFYYNTLIETPLFTLKAPKVSIIENKESVIFMIQSRI